MVLKQGTPLQGGKYVIQSVLGQGGFGITYLATCSVLLNGKLGQIESQVRVAIKEFFMKDYCSRDAGTGKVTTSQPDKTGVRKIFQKKFLKEAQNLSELHHPNIVKVMDVFHENDTVYYVMEHIDGKALDKQISEHTFSEASAISIMEKIGSAVSYLHDNMFNHLDIKPANILLRKNGDPVLIDFGISRHFNDEGMPTTFSPTAATKGYAPPEQELGEINQFWPAADIYALGATLYNMITGEHPPGSFSMKQDINATTGKHLSDRVNNAITAAMQIVPQRRPHRVSDFMRLLDVTIDNSPVVEVCIDTVETEASKTEEGGNIVKADRERLEQEIDQLIQTGKLDDAFWVCNNYIAHGICTDYARQRQDEIEQLLKKKSSRHNLIITSIILAIIAIFLILVISAVSEMKY